MPDLTGRRIVEVASRGKNLLVHFDDERVLHVHLKMNGRVRIERARQREAKAKYRASLGHVPRGTPQLELEAGGFVVTASRVPVLRVVKKTAAARELAELGPDLLDPSFSPADALAGLRALGDREVGDAIMIQSALAGIGNVFKSEVLFVERVNPRVKVSELDDTTLLRIVERAWALLRANREPGPRVTRSTLSPRRHWVYGRAGEPCASCGATVEAFAQGRAPPGRTTYHCPRCQA
ncbi:MAG: DNA-formamidopyrimidine glycosylase family protein [Rubrivivax sp.]